MRTMLRSKVTLLFMTLGMLLAVPAVAFAADQLRDDLEGTATTQTINVGDSFTNHYWVFDNGSNGCEVSATNPATITINTPTGVTASTSTLVFTQCGTSTSNTQPVTFTGNTASATGYSITASSNTNNVNTGQASFTLKVNAVTPSDTTPPVITQNVSPASPNGSNGWYNSGNVSVSYTVTDPESAITSKSAACDTTTTINTDITGQTVTCSATSAGGTDSKSVTIKRDVTPPTDIQFVGGPDAGGSYPFGSVPDEPTCTANGAVAVPASCVVTDYSTAVSAPGTHTMTATATDDAGNVATATRSYTVTKANQAALTVTAPNSGTYGDKLAMSASGGTTNGAITFNVTSDSDACEILTSGPDAGKLSITDGMGTCKITATMAGNANYNDVTSDPPHPVAVSKRAVTVTADAQSKKYGEDDPDPLTYQVTSGSLVTGDAFTGALTRAAGEDVGTYAIQKNDLALPTSKYTLTYVGADLTIERRPVTVTPDSDQGKTYGENDPAALSYTLSSPVGPPALVGTDTLNGALSRAPGNNAGTYLIGLGSLSGGPNYDLSLSSTPVYFTIDPRPITITADAKSKIFGQADPALTYQLTSGNLVGTDSFTGSLTRVPGEAPGQYDILNQGTDKVKVNDGNSGNNYAITYVGAKLTIGAWTPSGFYSPVGIANSVYQAPGGPVPPAPTSVNDETLNTVKGGSTVPLKFEIFAGSVEKTSTSDVKGFTTNPLSTCASGADEDLVDFTTTGSTSLRYDTTAGQFIQNWQTPKVMKDTCYRTIVTFQDGTSIHAFFKVRK
jgi:hypothetical protein